MMGRGRAADSQQARDWHNEHAVQLSTEVISSRTAQAVMDELIDRLIFRNGHRALALAAEILYKASQELVPTDTGVLKASGRITEEGNGYDRVAAVGYGGLNWGPQAAMSRKTGRMLTKTVSNYAVWVHRRPDQKHDKPTTYNFLFGPATPGTPTWDEMQRAVVEEMRKK